MIGLNGDMPFVERVHLNLPGDLDWLNLSMAMPQAAFDELPLLTFFSMNINFSFGFLVHRDRNRSGSSSVIDG
jgi:hypothetical protein